jgi:methylmalonyl-CoA/ethylmalonyl-CoA epimerase
MEVNLMENTGESAFSKVVQIGIVVKDVDQTMERLTALGIGPFKTSKLPPEREEWFREKRMYADFKFASAYIGDMQIELIQPLSGDSPHKEFLETKGEGIQHIACAVKDLQKEVDRLSQQGVEILLRAKFPGGGGAAYCDLGSGFIVELVERK